MIRSLTLLLLPLALVGCASPREVCIRDAQGPVREIARQISSTEVALARGYRLVTLRDRDFELRTCVARRADGAAFGYPCHRPVTRTRQEPVAIDYDEERAKLARLKARYAAAAAAADARVGICPPPG